MSPGRRARAYLWAAYRIRAAALPPGHPDIRAARDNLGNLLFEMRDWSGLLELTNDSPAPP